MPLKLLAVGDLHLGRRPGGLPTDLTDLAAGRAYGPAAALERIVATAIAERVDVVALAGDLVERDEDLFEAYGDLYRGVAALTEAGIRVVGVAGNHDVRVLPRLADEVSGFTLLGRGGVWESLELRSPDGTAMVLHGWSFPRPDVTTSPLRGQRFARDRRVAIGLLHCDRDQRTSRHAPVASRELADAGLDAWLLGHIHKPDALSVSTPSGYLGSATALRRSETGARGPWLYTVSATGIVGVDHWPLAPLRWEPLDIDMTGVADVDDARGHLLNAIRAIAAPIADRPMRPDLIGLRVRLGGRTSHRSAIARHLDIADLADLANVPVGPSLRAFVGTMRDAMLPDVDLATLARQPDPAGLMARRLLLLGGAGSDAAPRGHRDTGNTDDAGGPADHDDAAARAALLERARRRLTAVANDVAWQPLRRPPLSDDELIEYLRHAAVIALDALLAQHREPAA
jgi:DNA repair protein SbcD/Mre11